MQRFFFHIRLFTTGVFLYFLRKVTTLHLMQCDGPGISTLLRPSLYYYKKASSIKRQRFISLVVPRWWFSQISIWFQIFFLKSSWRAASGLPVSHATRLTVLSVFFTGIISFLHSALMLYHCGQTSILDFCHSINFGDNYH